MCLPIADTFELSDYRGGKDRLGWKEGRLEAQGEQLLQNLINREQSLATRVEQARSEANQTVEQAKAEAERILSEARASADSKAAQLRKEAEARAQAVREETLAAARQDAESIASRAQAGKAEAVKLVLERILS